MGYKPTLGLVPQKEMDKGRQADIADIKTKLKTAKGAHRAKLEAAGSQIAKEQADPWTRSARESLIDAARSGKAHNVRDVSEDIMKRREKNLGYGKTSFFFNLPDHLIKK